MILRQLFEPEMDFAAPGDQQCGQCPPNVPEALRGPCEQRDQG